VTPQARIKARYTEEAEAAGVQLSVTARKSNATEYTDHLFDGRIFYLIIRGEYSGSRAFQRATPLDFHGRMTSGSSFERTHNMAPRDIERILVETDVDQTWLQWNSRAILRIADGIRAKKTFGELRVLADALEEAGCDNPHMLHHCRAGTPHGNVCWVIELLAAVGREIRKGNE
jgi:hypothetical protein